MIGGVPTAILLIAGLLLIIAVPFVLLRRPIYECMAIAFVAVLIVTGRHDLFWEALLAPAANPFFYAIVAFLIAAQVFVRTQAVERIMPILLPAMGRVRGGGGYVALIGSTFAATLSGSAPANVATVGPFTIPLMKRTGYPPAMAATTEMACSALGNIIPPSGSVFLAFGVYEAMFPGTVSLGTFWLASWGVGLWFIAQRWLTIYAAGRFLRLTPLTREELPSLRAALRDGWLYLLIPIIIFLPLVFDIAFPEFIAGRLGTDGGKAFSSVALLATPAVAVVYAVALAARASRDERAPILSRTFHMLADTVGHVVPIATTVYFAYSIAIVFSNLGVDASVATWLRSLTDNPVLLVALLPVFTMVLGMVLPGTAQIAIFGGAFISIFVALDLPPLLLAVMLPAITGAMEGMTPPLALCMYVSMGIAESTFAATVRLALVWIALHLALSIVLLLGLLPILGVSTP